MIKTKFSQLLSNMAFFKNVGISTNCSFYFILFNKGFNNASKTSSENSFLIFVEILSKQVYLLCSQSAEDITITYIDTCHFSDQRNSFSHFIVQMSL